MSEPWEDDSGYDEEPAFFEVDGDQVVGGEVVADLDGEQCAAHCPAINGPHCR